MDYLNYGNKVQKKPSQKFTALQNSARKQPQEFLTVKPKTSNIDLNQKVDMSMDDFMFGDLNRSDVDLRKPEKILEQHQNDFKSFFNEKTTTNQQIKEPLIYTNHKTGEKHAGSLPTQVDESGGELIQLFPIPVYITRYRNDYTNEMRFIHNAECIGTNDPEQKQINNLYGKKNSNRQSVDNFILDNPELENIRKWIYLKVNEYARTIMGSKSEMVITQSWLNKNGRGESHHEHAHPNSMISGVWYPQINETLPPIEFRTPSHRDVTMQIETYNQFNSATFLLPMKMGELIMFPSNLSHSVQPNQSDEERISLSFNTWCKGNLGDKKSLTYLPLDRCV
tara:strand:- start:30 stop:1043 length:1014 start_codon:yes stop_codon:yes gene_type:complete